MKRIIVILLSAVFALGLFWTSAAAQEALAQADPKDVLDYLWDLSADMADEEFSKYAVRNFKFVQSIEPIVEPESYNAFYKASVHVKQKQERSKEEFINAQENLILYLSVADGVYFLWEEDNMPVVDGEEFTEEELDNGPLDSYGFIPLLVKCLIDDPAQAKGNIIAVAGGGFTNRSNSTEAYPAAEVFNELGYNVFVLQRRLRPYSNEDIWMDMQRAIRIVRYYAEKEGWGGQDMIASVGWSGGAGTVMGTVNYMYGDSNPSIYCSYYVPDEIDAVSSDTDVTMPIYGGWLEADCANPNLPALYTAVGTADETTDPFSDIPMPENVQKLYDDFVALGVPARIDIFEGAGHGFGVGQENAIKSVPECAAWPGYADEFMQANRGYSNVPAPAAGALNEIPVAPAAPEDIDAPAEYTQYKVFEGTYGFGDAEITVAANDDLTAFYITYISFDEDQILEGTVEDGIVTVTYDLTGFMAGDCQLIWDDAMASANEWVTR